MFVVYLHTAFLISILHDQLVTAVKLIAKENIHAAAVIISWSTKIIPNKNILCFSNNISISLNHFRKLN
jgi:hypothetical protein